MFLLQSPGDRRCFRADPADDENGAVTLRLSHFGDEPIREGQVRFTLQPTLRARTNQTNPSIPVEGAVVRTVRHSQATGTLSGDITGLTVRGDVLAPTPYELRAELTDRKPSRPIAANRWPIWLVPDRRLPGVRFHGSVDDATRALFETGADLAESTDPADAVIVARHFDSPLLDRLEAGARVLMLPDGKDHSFVLEHRGSLRGGPYLPGHPILDRVPRAFLIELPQFDLAGPVLPDLDAHLSEIVPILLRWDNRDLQEVRTHGLVFESQVGRGRLLVSALNHGPADNAAGHWLLGAFLDHLAGGPKPSRSWSAETLARLRNRINTRHDRPLGTPVAVPAGPAQPGARGRLATSRDGGRYRLVRRPDRYAPEGARSRRSRRLGLVSNDRPDPGRLDGPGRNSHVPGGCWSLRGLPQRPTRREWGRNRHEPNRPRRAFEPSVDRPAGARADGHDRRSRPQRAQQNRRRGYPRAGLSEHGASQSRRRLGSLRGCWTI